MMAVYKRSWSFCYYYCVQESAVDCCEGLGFVPPIIRITPNHSQIIAGQVVVVKKHDELNCEVNRVDRDHNIYRRRDQGGLREESSRVILFRNKPYKGTFSV